MTSRMSASSSVSPALQVLRDFFDEFGSQSFSVLVYIGGVGDGHVTVGLDDLRHLIAHKFVVSYR